MLFVDGPDRNIDILDLYSLRRQNSVKPVDKESIRCAITVQDRVGESTERHIFVGCTNGWLIRLDPVNYFTTLKVKLNNHIFCMLQIDENSILCG